MRRILESTCLFVLAVVVGLRPLVEETYDTAVDTLTASLATITSPSPLVTLGFDLVILLCALFWLLIRAMYPEKGYRRTGMEWGLGLLLIAGIVSCVVAGNQRIAINAVIDGLCYPILAIVLVQVTSQGWQRRVLLSVILASGCVQAYKCYDQVYYTAKGTQVFYEEQKANGFWEDQGVSLDSPQVNLYEDRLYANEATGYLAHGNVTGAYLMMCGLVASGLAIGRWRYGTASDGPRPASDGCLAVLSLAMAAVVMGAMALTRSKGAIGAGLLALVVWVIAAVGSRAIADHRRRFLILGWLAVVAGGSAVVSHGLYHGSLPGASLDFRWQYWKATANLLSDHVWTGVGRENFGREYLAYKSIDSPEEIANPHNLLIHTAAEWGALGLLGVCVMLLGASAALFRPPVDDKQDRRETKDSSGDDGRSSITSTLLWALGVGAAIFALRVPLLGTVNLNPAQQFSYVYAVTAIPAFVWLVSFCVLAGSSARITQIARGLSTAALTAVSVALLAFMVQEMISFGWFVPGCATTVFALAAVGISGRTSSSSEKGQTAPARRWVTFAAATVGCVFVFVEFALPVAFAQDALYQARYHAREGPTRAALSAQPVVQNYGRAADIDPLDPTPLKERSKWLARVAMSEESLRTRAFQLSVNSMRGAIERDPRNIQHHRALASILLARAGHTGLQKHYQEAMDAAAGVIELYPNDPSGWNRSGVCELAGGRATESRRWLRSAIKRFRKSLDLDDARPAWETIRRFTTKQREKIQEATQEARTLLERFTKRG